MKIRVVGLLILALMMQNVNAQEFSGDENWELNSTLVWQMKGFKVCKITNAYPYQGSRHYRS
ncbi:MAG: hypothetical protein ACI837_002207 [Crocinitomicaceae bacterium]|jgi:hypothetical protein